MLRKFSPKVTKSSIISFPYPHETFYFNKLYLLTCSNTFAPHSVPKHAVDEGNHCWAAHRGSGFFCAESGFPGFNNPSIGVLCGLCLLGDHDGHRPIAFAGCACCRANMPTRLTPGIQAAEESSSKYPNLRSGIDPEDYGVSCSCGQELLTPSPIPSLNLQFKAYKPKLSSGEDEKVILDQKSSQSSQVTDDSNSSETDQREKSASKGAVWFFLLVGLFVLLAIADDIIYATKGTSFFRWLGKLIGNVFRRFLG